MIDHHTASRQQQQQTTHNFLGLEHHHRRVTQAVGRPLVTRLLHMCYTLWQRLLAYKSCQIGIYNTLIRIRQTFVSSLR
eukprot:10467-Heterococcus_DN1.PRE.7